MNRLAWIETLLGGWFLTAVSAGAIYWIWTGDGRWFWTAMVVLGMLMVAAIANKDDKNEIQ